MDTTDCNIRVIGRFRPENAREKKETAGNEKTFSQLFKISDSTVVEVRQPGQSIQTFILDYIFPDSATQVKINPYQNKISLRSSCCINEIMPNSDYSCNVLTLVVGRYI